MFDNFFKNTIHIIVVIMFEITSLCHVDYVREEGYMKSGDIP